MKQDRESSIDFGSVESSARVTSQSAVFFRVSEAAFVRLLNQHKPERAQTSDPQTAQGAESGGALECSLPADCPRVPRRVVSRLASTVLGKKSWETLICGNPIERPYTGNKFPTIGVPFLHASVTGDRSSIRCVNTNAARGCPPVTDSPSSGPSLVATGSRNSLSDRMQNVFQSTPCSRQASRSRSAFRCRIACGGDFWLEDGLAFTEVLARSK
jgi:hypothetical protein